MHVTHIDHVSLNLSDRPAALDWFAEVLQLAPARRHDVPDEPVFLGPRGARLGLFGGERFGLRHVALATDAAGQLRLAARMDRLGVAYRPEQHRDHDSLYVTGPEGTVIEILVPTAGSELAITRAWHRRESRTGGA